MADDDVGAEEGGQTLVKAGRAASVLERYYSSFLSSCGPPYHDGYVVHVHTNKTIVACLAPVHPLIVALRNEASPLHVVRWTWVLGASPLIPRFSAETGLAATAAGMAWSSGGGKKPPTKMPTERNTQIATAVTSDGRVWPIRAAVQGWLVEINSNLTLGVSGGRYREVKAAAAAAAKEGGSAAAHMDVDASSSSITIADAAAVSYSEPLGSAAGSSGAAAGSTSAGSRPEEGPTAAARAVTRLLRDTPHAEGWFGIFYTSVRQREEGMKTLVPADAASFVYRRRPTGAAAAPAGAASGSASAAAAVGSAGASGFGDAAEDLPVAASASSVSVSGEGSALAVPGGVGPA